MIIQLYNNSIYVVFVTGQCFFSLYLCMFTSYLDKTAINININMKSGTGT